MTLSRLLRFRSREPEPPKKTLQVEPDGPGLTITLTDAPRAPNAEPARVLPIARKPEPE